MGGVARQRRKALGKTNRRKRFRQLDLVSIGEEEDFPTIRSLVILRLPQSTKTLQSRPPVTPPWRPKRKKSLSLAPGTIELSQTLVEPAPSAAALIRA
jgi:hypothetical protein